MFTMKKFAILAVAGFIASSIVACGDDGNEETEEEDTTSPIQLPESWGTKTGSVSLGNGNKGKAGSFLDVDVYPLVAIKKEDAAAKKNVIDVIFTGDKLITPKGCTTVDFCKTEMSGVTNEAALFVDVSTASLTATSTPAEIQALLQSATSSDLKNEVNANKDGKYIMFTSYESEEVDADGYPVKYGIAYIVINGAVGNDAKFTVGTHIVGE
jgi:hypothetical protein